MTFIVRMDVCNDTYVPSLEDTLFFATVFGLPGLSEKSEKS